MLFDTHAHLIFEEGKDDPEGDIARANENGVTHIATVGTDRTNNRASVKLAEKHENVYAVLGIHPHEADRFREDDFEELEELLQHAKAVAVGETGLDYYRNYADRSNQKALFERELELAVKTGMPAVLHVREAHRDGLAILRRVFPDGWTGIAHCFGGDAEDAEAYIELGFLISIAGTVTYKKANRLQEVVRNIPLDRLVLETDCPFLTPEPKRGKKRNEPAYVRHTAEKVAELKGISLEECAKATAENAFRVFRIRG